MEKPSVLFQQGFFSVLLMTSVKNAAVCLDVSLIQPDEASLSRRG